MWFNEIFRFEASMLEFDRIKDDLFKECKTQVLGVNLALLDDNEGKNYVLMISSYGRKPLCVNENTRLQYQIEIAAAEEDTLKGVISDIKLSLLEHLPQGLEARVQ